MDSSFRNGAWIKLHVIFKAGGPTSFGSWSFQCCAYLKNQPHCVTSWAPEVSNYNWSLGHCKVRSECTQLHSKALGAEYPSQQKKGCYIIPFRQSNTGVTSCKCVLRILSLPGGSQLLLLETNIPFSSYLWQPYRGSSYHNSQNLCCTSHLGSLEHKKS